MRKKNVHLVCNAHLDPVWLWRWQEGAAEVLSTFRAAVELCESNRDFIFNHNEAILYEWVQEYEPGLFRRIARLIEQGRWNIIGGWYIQPDCNMPSGESFVRQILRGKRYFQEQFGVDVTTAVNFDPFGHTQGLVQILAKSGYDSYLFMRPMKQDCALEGDEFVWVGYDGSEVMAARLMGCYNSPLGQAKQKIEQWISDYGDKSHLMIPWGVGNHGGGPSRKDIREVNRLIAQNNEFNVQHSTPQMFFRELQRRRSSLPRRQKDLNPWAPGCYTSQIRLKQKHRQLENELYAAEKMATAAGVMRYPTDELQAAERDLLFGEFHDILPGSSIQAAEEDALQLFDHGLEIVSRIKTRSFFALSSGQPKPKDGEIPIMVYNPHPFRIKRIIECEFCLSDAYPDDNFNNVEVYQKSRSLVCQVEKEASNLSCDWRKKMVFMAELEPGRMNRFDCRVEELASRPRPRLRTGRDRIHFKTKDLDVIINTRTGLVDRYRGKGVDYVEKGAFMPLVIKDNADSWEMKHDRFRKVAGRFRLMSKKAAARFCGVGADTVDAVRVVEDGPARSVVEAMFSYGDSFILNRYKLPKAGTEIELESRVYWNEKDRMLKLSIPTPGAESSKYVGQVSYGVSELPADGREAVAQKWVAVLDRQSNRALTCINDGVYGSDFSSDGLRLTLLRSAAYSCDQGRMSKDGLLLTESFMERMEQGERLFRFWFNAGTISERLKRVDREALVCNEKPMALSFFPPGGGSKPRPMVVLSDDVVQITAIKKAEKNSDIIVRLFEPTGRVRSTVLELPFIGKKVKLKLNGFEIKTLRINPRTKKIREVDLIERLLPKRK